MRGEMLVPLHDRLQLGYYCYKFPAFPAGSSKANTRRANFESLVPEVSLSGFW